MGVISDLPDQILHQILSWLPTREVVATMLLSKRWEFLWKQVPRLDYDFRQYDGKNFSEFVNRSMQLQEGLVCRSFKLSVSPYCETRDVGTWIDFAVSRMVRELDIDLTAAENPMITTLPKSLYTCGTLTCLKLKAIVLDDIPEEYPVCLSSLHNLYLSVSCQVSADKFIGKLSAGAPRLKKSVVQGHVYGDDQFLDSMRRYSLFKSFTLCSSQWNDVTNIPYFDELEHLCMCTCSALWWDLLIVFLHCTPKLRYLQLTKSCNLRPLFLWDDAFTTSTTPLPKCLSSTLQTLEMRDYIDTQFEKDVVSFLLENATCLTKANIFTVATASPIVKLRIHTYLSNLTRGSTACQLVFR